VLQENARSIRPLGGPRLRREDCIRKDFPNITGEDKRKPGLERGSGEQRIVEEDLLCGKMVLTALKK